MRRKGDRRAAGQPCAEFDDSFDATALGGAALAERAMRGLGVRRMIGKHLGNRSETAQVTMGNGVYAMMAGMPLGGKGHQACERLREDAALREIFSVAQVPSSPTVYRILCELAGLPEREEAQCTEPCGPQMAALDMLGREQTTRRLRKVVPAQPEAASAKSLVAFEEFESAVATACAVRLHRRVLSVSEWYVVFGDAADLEVEGDCFDAA